jgi:hypothetical protein
VSTTPSPTRFAAGAEAAAHPAGAPARPRAPASFDDAPASSKRRRKDDPNVAVFDFDPGHADAAEDLAGELGIQFVEGATRVEDLSDRVVAVEVVEESEVGMIIEDELGPEDINDDLPDADDATESLRFSIDGSEGDGLPDDDVVDEDEFDVDDDDGEDQLDDLDADDLDGDDLDDD